MKQILALLMVVFLLLPLPVAAADNQTDNQTSEEGFINKFGDSSNSLMRGIGELTGMFGGYAKEEYSNYRADNGLESDNPLKVFSHAFSNLNFGFLFLEFWLLTPVLTCFMILGAIIMWRAPMSTLLGAFILSWVFLVATLFIAF